MQRPSWRSGTRVKRDGCEFDPQSGDLINNLLIFKYIKNNDSNKPMFPRKPSQVQRNPEEIQFLYQ